MSQPVSFASLASVRENGNGALWLLPCNWVHSTAHSTAHCTEKHAAAMDSG